MPDLYKNFNKYLGGIMEFDVSKYRITKEYVLVYIELISAAKYHGTITYQEIAQIMDLPWRDEDTIREVECILGEISEDEVGKERPMLSAIAVNDQGQPGQSFYSHARYFRRLNDQNETTFWKDECQAVYDIWKTKIKDNI